MKKIIFLPVLAAFTLTSLLILDAPGAECRPYKQPTYTQHKYHKPAVIIIPVAPDYYYTVGEGDIDVEERIAERVVRRFGQVFGSQPKQGSVVAAGSNPVSATDGFDDSSFRLMGKANVTPNQDSGIVQLFETHCIQCHKPGASKPGNITLLNPGSYLHSDPDPQKERRRRKRVYESVESGDMPKNAQSLPASQKKLLEQWAASTPEEKR